MAFGPLSWVDRLDNGGYAWIKPSMHGHVSHPDGEAKLRISLVLALATGFRGIAV